MRYATRIDYSRVHCPCQQPLPLKRTTNGIMSLMSRSPCAFFVPTCGGLENHRPSTKCRDHCHFLVTGLAWPLRVICLRSLLSYSFPGCPIEELGVRASNFRKAHLASKALVRTYTSKIPGTVKNGGP